MITTTYTIYCLKCKANKVVKEFGIKCSCGGQTIMAIVHRDTDLYKNPGRSEKQFDIEAYKKI